MIYYTIKVMVSAIIVGVISEVLAIVWLYYDTHDTVKVAGLARSTFWFVLPSLAFFLLFPFLLDRGRGFPVSLVIALAATGVCYALMAFILKNAGVKL